MKRFILTMLVFFVSGCGYEIKKSGTTTPPTQSGEQPVTEPVVGTQVTFSSIQKSILTPACLRCHNGPDGAGGVDLSTHAGVLEWVSPGNATDSTLYDEVITGRMPKRAPRLSDEQCNAIKTWINEGAKNN